MEHFHTTADYKTRTINEDNLFVKNEKSSLGLEETTDIVSIPNVEDNNMYPDKDPDVALKVLLNLNIYKINLLCTGNLKEHSWKHRE